LDLIEVSPLSQPPVAKILDYSKLKYQEEKERRKEKARQKKIEVKGIRLSLKISKHDIETRLNQAERFLSEDNKVKIELILRGRERQRKDFAKNIINDFIKSLEEKLPIKIEQGLKIQGGRLSATVAKKQ
jgi:translation initiation factor IF-3